LAAAHREVAANSIAALDAHVDGMTGTEAGWRLAVHRLNRA
jgi:hypothetical protein